MSVRQPHLTFARAGTAFGRMLLDLRMAQAQRLLRDPRHAHLPVGEIAGCCGFSDLSHFARRFRSAFAASPKAYRSAPPASHRPVVWE
jgi:AraC-like DNA-binding protein